MYLTVKKEQIIEGLQKAASIIPSKAGAAYLRSIWLQAVKTPDGDRLTVMSTDVNIEFTGTYPAEIKEEGTAGVNGRAFVELLRRLPGGDISLRLDEESHILSVEQGRRSYKLPTVDPVWFQPLPPFPEDGSVLWSGDFFQDIIDRVSFCISDDDSAEGLACLYLKAGDAGKVDVCGLNGHQFAMVRFINDELARLLPENGLLIQKKYVNELRKWLGSDEVMLNISERRFHIRTGSGSETLSIPRSANFTYPDHLSFLARLDGDNTSQLDVDRRETLNALDRLLIFNNDSDRCTYFRFSPQEVELSAQGQETGSATEHLEGAFKGDLELIAFPTRSLMDILGHFQSATLHYVFTGAEGPCGITGSDDAEYTVILMPMKIAESSYYTEEE
ncbi:DNA polymerase III subunit beta [Mailhella sp.]|uniref:DNA polymerase III subunit beta n=1 Tax=Mailhella sp. TaxID=1981029 RepID=UPI003AB81681